jgi:hypothetical protein
MDEAKRPSPGDYSICLSCASVLVFDDALRPTAPTVGELMKIMRGSNGDEIRRYQTAVRNIDRSGLSRNTKEQSS